jgi:hypothetical protein
MDFVSTFFIKFREFEFCMKKKNAKKKVGAFLLTLLALSGGVAAVPFSSNVGDLSCGNLKSLSQNAVGFVQIENLAFADDVDYFNELNKLFTENLSDEEFFDPALFDSSLANGDYETWKEEFVKIGGACDSGFISKEEFEILRKIKKSSD